MEKIMRLMWSFDSKIDLLPWRSRDLPPITSRSTFPKTKDALGGYVDNLFLREGDVPYPRFRIGHVVPIEEILNESLKKVMQKTGQFISREPIQHQYIKKVGFLAGIDTRVLDKNLLQETLTLHPSIGGLEIEVRLRKLTIENVKSEHRVVYIHCNANHLPRVRSALLKLYSSKSKSFPMMLQGRFVPDHTNTRFTQNLKATWNAQRSLLAHDAFMNQTNIGFAPYVWGLDHYDDHLQMTGRQAVMGLRSASDPSKNLFVAAEEAYDGGDYGCKVVYHNKFRAEANTVLSSLALILEQQLGPRIWNWFTPESQNYFKPYKCDPQKGVVSADGSNTEIEEEINFEFLDLDDKWMSPETAVPMPTIEFDGNFLVKPDDAGLPQYNDDGSLKTKFWEEAAIEDSRSVSSGMLDISMFTSLTDGSAGLSSLSSQFSIDPKAISALQLLMSEVDKAAAAKTSAGGPNE